MCQSANVWSMRKFNAAMLSFVMFAVQNSVVAEVVQKLRNEPTITVKQGDDKKPSVSSSSSNLSGRPLTPPPFLLSLESTNEFDKQRQLWPDKVPPAPPPPPPPPPTPLTDQDVQIYGVVIIGKTKRATVKYGPRFASLNTSGKPFITISEGQVIGEYTLTGIKPTHLIMTAPGGQQQISFNKKMDRGGGGGQVVSAPSGTNDVDPSTGGNQQNLPQTVASNDGNVKPPAAAPQTAGTPTAAVNSENALKNPAPGSLAAAIVAAQAAAQNPPPQTQTTPPPANFNPFLQLFPKQ